MGWDGVRASWLFIEEEWGGEDGRITPLLLTSFWPLASSTLSTNSCIQLLFLPPFLVPAWNYNVVSLRRGDCKPVCLKERQPSQFETFTPIWIVRNCHCIVSWTAGVCYDILNLPCSWLLCKAPKAHWRGAQNVWFVFTFILFWAANTSFQLIWFESLKFSEFHIHLQFWRWPFVLGCLINFVPIIFHWEKHGR